MSMEELVGYILGNKRFTLRNGGNYDSSEEFEVRDVDLSSDDFKGLPGDWTFVHIRGQQPQPDQGARILERAKQIARKVYGGHRLPFFVTQDNTIPLDNLRYWDTPAFFHKRGDHQPGAPPRLTPFFLAIKTRVGYNANLARVLLPDITKPAKSWSFFGREKELDDLIYTGSNFIVAGGRRIGKTSLLQAVDRKLRSLGHHVVYLDVQAYQSAEDVIFELAKVTGARDLWHEYRRGRGHTEQLLQDSLRRLGRDGKKAVLLMDELGNLLSDSSAEGWLILGALRKYSQAGGFRFIFTCFQEAFLRQMEDPAGPLVNSAETLRLTPFSDKEVSEFFFSIVQYWATPNQNEKKRITDMILTRVGPHPYALVCLCSAVVKSLVVPQNKGVLAAVQECVHAKMLETFSSTVDEIFNKTKDATLKYVVLKRLNQPPVADAPLSSLVIDDDWLESTLHRAGFDSTVAGRTKIFAGLEMHGFTGRDRSLINRQRIALPLLYHYLIDANRTIEPLLAKLMRDMQEEMREFDMKPVQSSIDEFYDI